MKRCCGLAIWSFGNGMQRAAKARVAVVVETAEKVSADTYRSGQML